MRITSFSLLLILLLTSNSYSQNTTKNFIDQPYIEVTGQVETEIVPNEIYLNIQINENDKRGKLSIEEQESIFISTLKAIGIHVDEQLSVSDFDGFYQRKFLAENKMSKIKKYQLIVHDGETLAKVYHKLDQIDISNISIQRVSHSDIEKFKRETKINAIKVAKEKAAEYGEAIDQTIGKAIFIKEIQAMPYGSNTNYSNQAYLNQAVTVRAKGIKFQNLELENIILTEKVMVKFILN